MIDSRKTNIVLMAIVAATTACSPLNSNLGKGFAAFNWEAGKELNEGNFGKPNLNNLVVQSAYRNQNGLLMDLQRRFEKEVPTMVNFNFNSSRLDSRSRAVLDRQADWIKQFPEIKFRVYGHTDLVGTARYNKGLGLRRANRAVNYLISKGIGSDRLQAVVSYGETQPLIVTEGKERRNRRTVTEVIGFARNFVGDGLDGKYAHLIYRKYIAGGISTDQANSTN
ncbi:MAG: OmpA family protein [Paracoccaceae bacterium]